MSEQSIDKILFSLDGIRHDQNVMGPGQLLDPASGEWIAGGNRGGGAYKFEKGLCAIDSRHRCRHAIAATDIQDDRHARVQRLARDGERMVRGLPGEDDTARRRDQAGRDISIDQLC